MTEKDYRLLYDIASKRIEELEKENRLLGKRCNQLLKDKGDLTDKIADIKAKAKEIINKVLYEYQYLCLIKKDTIADAEQFLKEIE